METPLAGVNVFPKYSPWVFQSFFYVDPRVNPYGITDGINPIVPGRPIAGAGFRNHAQVNPIIYNIYMITVSVSHFLLMWLKHVKTIIYHSQIHHFYGWYKPSSLWGGFNFCFNHIKSHLVPSGKLT